MLYFFLAVRKYLEPAGTENMVSRLPASDPRLGVHQGTPQKQSWPGTPLEVSWESPYWARKGRS